jgi:undecaprenyl pyrophosphate synthase
MNIKTCQAYADSHARKASERVVSISDVKHDTRLDGLNLLSCYRFSAENLTWRHLADCQSAIEAQNVTVLPRKSHRSESASLHNNEAVRLELVANTQRVIINK